MFTKEQLAKWRSEGFQFDSFYDQVAVEKPTEEDLKKYSISGYWSSDPQGKKIIGHATLATVVYYHVKTTGIPDGKNIVLKLFDDDGLFLKPDEKFNKKELIKTITIRNGKASFALPLEESWNVNIEDDIGFEIELYWVAYQKEFFFMGEKLGSILNVAHSVNYLYFSPPVENYNLPEILTSTGQTIVFAIGDALDAKDHFIEKLDDCRFFIGARVLEKGKLISNINEIYERKRSIYNYNIFTNDGKLVKLRQASNFGFKNVYVNNGRPVTSKGLSQIDYFSNKGVLNTALKCSKELLTIWDVTDLTDIMFKNGLGTVPIPSPWAFASSILTEFVIKPEVEDIINKYRNRLAIDFEVAKQKGIEACLRFVSIPDPLSQYNYEKVDTACIQKLLSGKIKSLRELVENINGMPEHTIFYRQIKGDMRNPEDFMHIIDCIFVSDKLLKTTQ